MNIIDKYQKNIKWAPNKPYKNNFLAEYTKFWLFCDDKGLSKQTLTTKTHI